MRILPEVNPSACGPGVSNDGVVEETKAMNQLLRMAHADGHSWFDVLSMAEMAMSNAPISHTEFPPFFLDCGFDPCLMADVFDQKAH